MFAASRSSSRVASRKLSSAAAGNALRQPTIAPKIAGRDLRLLSTLLPASFGTTLHICSLEKASNSITDGPNTLAAYNTATTTKSGWGFSSLSRFMSSSSSSTPSLTDEISNLIDNHKVVIFSKSYCPYCSATKKLFHGMNLEGVVVIELDRDPRGQEIQRELQHMTGQRTVPNVFVNGTHLGGNSDAQAAAQSGKLQEMLK